MSEKTFRMAIKNKKLPRSIIVEINSLNTRITGAVIFAVLDF